MAFYPGKGTVLKISTANASTTLAACAQITAIRPGGYSNPEVDVTTLDSTMRQFIGSIADGGSFTVDLVYDHNEFTHKRFLTLVANSTPEETKIVFATTVHNILFRSVVTAFQKQDIVVDDALRASATFKVDGTPTVSTA
jgi:hypothetical protein